ncbi:MAG: YlbF family regulator [Anaeroplasmataceae bacterium]|nr:YlbF family regulator [Anaeroplasmataceae bacterium]
MNELKEAFLKMPEVERIHELEDILDKNKSLNELLSKLKLVQKQLVNAKEYNQPKQYTLYKKEYDELYSKILDFPFVEEYMDLLEVVNDRLHLVCDRIEGIISEKIK